MITTQLLATLFIVAAAHASSSWNHFRGNAQLSGVATAALAEELELLWTFSAEDGIESTAAIQGQRTYIGSLDGHLYALDLQSGMLQWKYRADGEIKSSPTVLGDNIYFGDEEGTFHALNAQTGARQWTFKTQGGISSSANAAGQRLVFGSYDQHLYCLEADDGALVWKLATDGYIHSTPALYGDFVLVTGCDAQLRLVHIKDGSEKYRLSLGAYIGASAAVVGQRAFVGTFANEVLGIDLEQADILWRYQNPQRQFPFYASPAATQDIVIVGGRDKMVHALNPQTGEVLWMHAAGGRVDSSPVIAGDRVYYGGPHGLVALELELGKEVWRFDTGAAISASPAIAAGKLLIGAMDGIFYCFGQEVNHE